MTPFFLPGAQLGSDSDRAYGELRAEVAKRIGQSILKTRIYALTARREGADSETRVGERDPCAGETVHAIFATPEGYTVIWEGGHADLGKRQIYEAVPFD